MNRSVLVLLTLLWPIAVISQGGPSINTGEPGCKTPSQTVLLTVENPSAVALNAADVLVSVDKQPFAPVSSLQSASSAPLDLVLVVDSSESAAEYKLRSTALDEVPKFVAAVRASGITVRTAIADYGETSRVVQDFSTGPIEGSLQRLSPHGGSPLYDTLGLAAHLAQQPSASNRRLILVLTDGVDNASHTTREKAAQAAIRASTPIYALSLGKRPAKYGPGVSGEKVLKEMSAQTGGKAYFPKNAAQVAEVLSAIRSEMQKHYFAVVAVPMTKKDFYKVKFKTPVPRGALQGAAAITCN